jgi:hypothetical protein
MNIASISLGWRIFIGIELVAVFAWLSWDFFSSTNLWAVQFILLMPGDVIIDPIVEHVLWGRNVSLLGIGIVALVASLAFNALIWAFALIIVRRIRRAASARPKQ